MRDRRPIYVPAEYVTRYNTLRNFGLVSVTAGRYCVHI